MSVNASYAADFGIVIALYGLKALLFRSVRSAGFSLGCFFFIVALFVPVTWLTSPDWNNQNVARIAIWVGDPIAILPVPSVSFLFDFFSHRRYTHYWRIRVSLEIFAAFPLWVFIWVMIQVIVFNWVWI